jgi:hypothetical protein
MESTVYDPIDVGTGLSSGWVTKERHRQQTQENSYSTHGLYHRRCLYDLFKLRKFILDLNSIHGANRKSCNRTIQ